MIYTKKCQYNTSNTSIFTITSVNLNIQNNLFYQEGQFFFQPKLNFDDLKTSNSTIKLIRYQIKRMACDKKYCKIMHISYYMQ